jgi:hypothetical protein
LRLSFSNYFWVFFGKKLTPPRLKDTKKNGLPKIIFMYFSLSGLLFGLNGFQYLRQFMLPAETGQQNAIESFAL